MNNKPITLSASEAQTLNTTGHIEGFKELCEWQPDFEITAEMRTDSIDGLFLLITPSGKCGVLSPYLTPTRAVGQVYACKEPHNRVYYQNGSCEYLFGLEKPNYSAEELPDGQEDIHAKIATEPTLSIHEGKLVWTCDLVKE